MPRTPTTRRACHRFALLGMLISRGITSGAAQTPEDTAATTRPRSLDAVVVTATRAPQIAGTLPANVTVLGSEAARSSFAQTLPGLLGRLPGSTSRDYQHSLATSPSRSALSFRGLGGTSAGRTLILFDGVPVNDPFGGAVHWARLPMALVDRVEVVRGGGAMAWGSRALGGVVNVLPVRADRNRLSLDVEGGGYGTVRGSIAGTMRTGRVLSQAAGSWGTSDGFQTIRPDLAGDVDVPYSTDYRTVFGRASIDLGQSWQAWVAGNYLDEAHRGPTSMDSGPATVGELRAGARWSSGGGGLLELSAYGNHRTELVIASNVTEDRSTETPRSFQRTPSDGRGASLQWSQPLADHILAIGSDVGLSRGTSTDDYGWVADAMSRRRTTEGRQVIVGAYAQDTWALGGAWQLLAGLRYDQVHSSRGSRVEENLATGEVLADSAYAANSTSRLSFSAGVRHGATSWLSWRASAYQAFRAPTLNEMYRPNKGTGRGNITEANPALLPERLVGVELGVDLTPSEAVLVRLGGFWNDVQDAIVDYTVGKAAENGEVIEPCGTMLRNQVCRERRNIERLRTSGLEAELEIHPHPEWAFWGSYTLNPTRVSAAGQQIDGKVARSAPRQAMSAFLSWEDPSLLGVTVEVRSVGLRYEDDINTLELDAFTVAGLRINRRLFQRSSLYLKVENVFDAAYPVTRSTTGIVEEGAPRWVLLGMHASW